MLEVFLAQQPTAKWNPAIGVWETEMVNLICGHSELYSATWQTSGMMLSGRVYELPTLEHHITDTESSSLDSVAKLPTVLASGPMRNSRRAMVTHPTKRSSVGLNQAIELAQGILPKEFESWDEVPLSLLPTPNTMDSSYARTPEELAAAKERTGAGYRNLREVVINELPALLPTPTVSDQFTGSLKSSQQSEGSLHSVTLAQIVNRPDLLPTPTVGDQRDGKHLRSIALENLAEGKSRGIGLNHLVETIGLDWQEGDRFEQTETGIRKVEEPVVLLPTPIVDDHKNTGKNTNRFPSLASVTQTDLLPTPKARDAIPEGYEAGLRRNSPQLGTVVRAMTDDDLALLGTPRVSNDSSSKQVALGAPKARLEDQVIAGREGIIEWGRFEPAIRRWERTIGRPAPEPTRPDGKEGNHRLNPVFTEWMMGLPEGWLTGIGLSRNNELKACGNGVVPQQAALALRQLLAVVDNLDA